MYVYFPNKLNSIELVIPPKYISEDILGTPNNNLELNKLFDKTMNLANALANKEKPITPEEYVRKIAGIIWKWYLVQKIKGIWNKDSRDAIQILTLIGKNSDETIKEQITKLTSYRDSLKFNKDIPPEVNKLTLKKREVVTTIVETMKNINLKEFTPRKKLLLMAALSILLIRLFGLSHYNKKIATSVNKEIDNFLELAI